MNDDELATLYALAFPEDHNQWGAGAFASFRDNPHNHILTSENAALLGQIIADEAEIISIFVHPNARQQGFGGDLLRQFLEICTNKNVTSIYLEVAEDNQPAQKLYAQYEFKLVGNRTQYYKRKNGSRIDARLLRRDV